jgi:hypothetical protein
MLSKDALFQHIRDWVSHCWYSIVGMDYKAKERLLCRLASMKFK